MPSATTRNRPAPKTVFDMKHLLRPLLCTALWGLLVLLVGCEKDSARHLPVRIQPFSAVGKVYLDSYTPEWNDGDQINISGYDETVDVTHRTVGVTSDDVTLYACYPADAVNSYAAARFDITLPTVQTYSADASGHQSLTAPMAASGTDRLDFYNLCALVRVQVPDGMTVKYIDLATTDATPLSGRGQVTFAGAMPAFVFSEGQTYPYTRLDCGSGVARDDNMFYLTVPAVSGKRFQITLCVVDGGSLYRRTVTQRSAASLAVSQYGPAVLSFDLASMTDITPPAGALAEVFSLGSTTQAYFASGNLQYQGSTATWRLAPTQYSAIGADNSNIGESYTGWIDLFGWGTTGQQECAAPWRSQQEEDGYSVGNNVNRNMDATYDWGVNIGAGWHTPARAEWEYLINTRAGAADKKAAAIVNGVRGLLLLPDYWLLPAGCTFTTTDTNRYTAAQWTQMERHGALFLPAAGYREVTTINSFNSLGWYWASDVASQYNCNALKALDAPNAQVARALVVNRARGNSVRLVKTR